MCENKALLVFFKLTCVFHFITGSACDFLSFLILAFSDCLAEESEIIGVVIQHLKIISLGIRSWK